MNQIQCLTRLFEHDEKCKVILVTAFGGMLSMEKIAGAFKQDVVNNKYDLKKPIVAYFNGLDSEKAYETMHAMKKKIDFHPAYSIEEACRLAVELSE